MRQTVVALVLVVWCAPVLGPLGPSSSTAQESAGPHVVQFSPEGTRCLRNLPRLPDFS